MSYEKYWSEEGAEYYGYDDYCKELVKLVLKNRPKKVYDLACGNGFPFIGNLLNKGVDIYGSDKSELLISELKRKYPKAKVKVGDYKEIIEEENEFDVSYCFRSSWYFEDVYRMIDELIRITKPEGKIIFDVIDIEKTKISLKDKLKKKICFWNFKQEKYYPKIEDIKDYFMKRNLKYTFRHIKNKVIFKAIK